MSNNRLYPYVVQHLWDSGHRQWGAGCVSTPYLQAGQVQLPWHWNHGDTCGATPPDHKTTDVYLLALRPHGLSAMSARWWLSWQWYRKLAAGNLLTHTGCQFWRRVVVWCTEELCCKCRNVLLRGKGTKFWWSGIWVKCVCSLVRGVAVWMLLHSCYNVNRCSV
jgi:hypothetical protein